MAIAFFDLDLTLISVNSAAFWVRREYRLQRISRFDLLRAGVWLGLYRLGLGRLESALEAAIASQAGRSAEQLRKETHAFWHEEIAPWVRPGAWPALERHAARGDPRVILTSSSPWISEAASAHFGLEDYVSTRFEVVDGTLTGRGIEPLCFGAGKLANAERYARERGESLGDATFYTDSHSDRQVLEAVGHPVCICPDPRLERLARQKGWEIRDWGRPGDREGPGEATG